VIAFKADNPGYWFLHCHVELHLIDGMGVLIQEYPNEQHWAPPKGINQHGSFQWSVSEYIQVLNKEEICLFGKVLLPMHFTYYFVVISMSLFL